MLMSPSGGILMHSNQTGHTRGFGVGPSEQDDPGPWGRSSRHQHRLVATISPKWMLNPWANISSVASLEIRLD